MSDTSWVPKPVAELVNSPVVKRAAERFMHSLFTIPFPFQSTGPHVSMDTDASFIQVTFRSLDSSQATGSAWAEENVRETMKFRTEIGIRICT